MKPAGVAIGRVEKDAIIVPSKPPYKPFVGFTLICTDGANNEKDAWLFCRLYRNDPEDLQRTADDIKRGQLITVYGEFRAESLESKKERGKHYGVLKMFCRGYDHMTAAPMPESPF